ncbi:unnamed protein product [Danaus chrysippus]|uniref:(African queen) hypothetical protein n=1 Tax=Danaus chrysippus TaxID=151541 RepID=A0A8J2QHD6_9NEOP|nr:unnamed protein product [Danaus chrysippus]
MKLTIGSSQAEDRSKTTYGITRNVVAISLAFMMCYTAYNGTINLQSSINADAGLGTLALSVSSAGYVVSNMFLPVLLIKWIGTKWTICLSYLAFTPYYAAQVYPNFYTFIPTAAILGLGGASLWCAKSAYLCTASENHNKISNIPLDVLLSRFFGIFFMIYQLNQVLGNLISSLVLSLGDNEAAMTAINDSIIPKLCGGNYYPSTGAEEVMLEQPQERIQILTGMEQAYFAADFTSSFVSCSIGVGIVGFVMMTYGLVDAIGSVMVGHLAKKVGRIPLMLAAFVIQCFVLVFLLCWSPQSDQKFVVYILACLWGLCDAIWMVQSSEYFRFIKFLALIIVLLEMKLTVRCSQVEERSKTTYDITRNVVAISLAFMISYIAYNGTINLQSSINADAGLGTLALSIAAAGFVVSNMFLPVLLIKWIGTKWTICVSFLAYTPYYAAQVYPNFYTFIPTAVIMGFGGASLWCAKSAYLCTSFVSCAIGVGIVGFVMMTYGLVDAIGSVMVGQLAKKVGRIPLMLAAFVTHCFVLVFLLCWSPQSDQKFVVYILACLWGLCDAIWMVQSSEHTRIIKLLAVIIVFLEMKITIRSSRVEDRPKTTYEITKNVVAISLAFMISSTAYSGTINLQSSINADAGLGTLALGISCAGFVVSNMFLPVLLIKWIGTKWTICVSFLAYTPYYAAQVYPNFYTLIPTAWIMGFGGASLWCAKSAYLCAASEDHKNISNIALDILLSRFFGIFFMIYQLNQVLGNLISSLVLSLGDNEAAITAVNDSIIPILCGANYFPSTDAEKALQEQPKERIQILAGLVNT